MFKSLVNKISQVPIRYIYGIYFLITLAASIQQMLIDQLNNYYIFKYSFQHLIHNQNLYILFPDQYHDNYKYGPVFGIFIAPFAILPDWLGIIAWTMVNAFLLLWAIHKLTIGQSSKIFIYWFILIEFLTSIQNLQANPMLTSLILFCFIAFERRTVFWAAFFVALGGFFKIYGFIGAAFFLLYPQKIRFILSFAFWCVVLFFLPLIFISLDQLLFLYKEWYLALVEKAQIHHDISLIQILQSLVSSNIKDAYVVLTGVGIFCLAYLRWDKFETLSFRLLFLASVLIWMVIFSPGAESPTFVIAVTGVALWYIQSERKKWQISLAIFVFVLTILSPTDIFPAYLRDVYVIPYSLKALPCAVVWIVVMVELLFGSFSKVSSPSLTVAQ
ncbi:glycosyltransferase family 87 protein [Cytophagaceae bacterium DM2B3-1]|uniref:Glycosyltransferase family 87 protein n=1 Tax=Xanthocytophaga flava TaxID=3048013 RepID=A0ABT7CU72_9BACT|nr:glycosyltransferase family 87 protein [Xanthocytophaga flavus]MDJ1469140.1 glycosyltransferase family 87 protein [Xanthocytophaga flavus]MDJ1497314.1 glycosyltransferase family 87 protein [Xanthocytophaga flavus]